MFDYDSCIGRLRPARLWEGGARCFVGRFSFGRRMVSEAGAFLEDEGFVTSFSKRGASDSLHHSYCG